MFQSYTCFSFLPVSQTAYFTALGSLFSKTVLYRTVNFDMVLVYAYIFNLNLKYCVLLCYFLVLAKKCLKIVKLFELFV